MPQAKLTKALLMIAAVLMCIAPQAWAQPINTGSDFMTGCRAAERMMADNEFPSSPEVFTAGLCIGHVHTALVYLKMLRPLRPYKDDDICIPDSVKVTQFLGVLNKYMRENPEWRQEAFNKVIAQAAVYGWPCNPK